MTISAPRSFNRDMYDHHSENVFYGTDDGFLDGSFGEFPKIRAHYAGVAPNRRNNVHMVSVVGGLYGYTTQVMATFKMQEVGMVLWLKNGAKTMGTIRKVFQVFQQNLVQGLWMPAL